MIETWKTSEEIKNTLHKQEKEKNFPHWVRTKHGEPNNANNASANQSKAKRAGFLTR